MTTKREAPKRGDDNRRRGRDSAPRAPRKAPADAPASRHHRRRGGKASTPDRQPRGPRSGPQTTPVSRPAERAARPKSASQAKARAKARKAKAPRIIRPPLRVRLRDRLLTRLASIDLRPRTLASKVPFVVLVIGSLGMGLGLTLWLSTDSAEHSYQLGNARVRNQILQQQKEALERDVLEAEAAPALAEAARNLGMIPSRDTAHLVQDPSGSWVVVGTPKPAQGVPPPPLNSKLPDDKPAAPKPPPNPVEMPVLVSPGPGQPPVPAMPGPEVLLRAPDGASTLGSQHLPTETGPLAAGVPDPRVVGPAPDASQAPAPADAVPPPAAEPPAVEPPAAVPPPAAIPPPAAPAPAAPLPVAGPPPAPVAPPPAAAPPNSEQFGPVTVTAPGAPR